MVEKHADWYRHNHSQVRSRLFHPFPRVMANEASEDAGESTLQRPKDDEHIAGEAKQEPAIDVNDLFN